MASLHGREAIPFGPARHRIDRDVVFRELAGEAVLLHLRTGVYFGLDPVGTRIWQLIVEGKSFQETLDVLVAEYDVGEGRAAADLRDFIVALRQDGLIDEDAPRDW